MCACSTTSLRDIDIYILQTAVLWNYNHIIKNMLIHPLTSIYKEESTNSLVWYSSLTPWCMTNVTRHSLTVLLHLKSHQNINQEHLVIRTFDFICKQNIMVDETVDASFTCFSVHIHSPTQKHINRIIFFFHKHYADVFPLHV